MAYPIISIKAANHSPLHDSVYHLPVLAYSKMKMVPLTDRPWNRLRLLGQQRARRYWKSAAMDSMMTWSLLAWIERAEHWAQGRVLALLLALRLTFEPVEDTQAWGKRRVDKDTSSTAGVQGKHKGPWGELRVRVVVPYTSPGFAKVLEIENSVADFQKKLERLGHGRSEE